MANNMIKLKIFFKICSCSVVSPSLEWLSHGTLFCYFFNRYQSRWSTMCSTEDWPKLGVGHEEEKKVTSERFTTLNEQTVPFFHLLLMTKSFACRTPNTSEEIHKRNEHFCTNSFFPSLLLFCEKISRTPVSVKITWQVQVEGYLT